MNTSTRRTSTRMFPAATCIIVLLLDFFHLVTAVDDTANYQISKSEHHRYRTGDAVPLHVGPIFSTQTQLHLDSYSDSLNLPICHFQSDEVQDDKNEKQQEQEQSWLDKLLTLTPAPPIHKLPSTTLQMNENKHNQTLCVVDVTNDTEKPMAMLIRRGYHHHWFVDYVPTAAQGRTAWTRRYAGGFPMGFIAPDTNMGYVFNHFNIYVDYHDHKDGTYSVVGAAVEPLSVKKASRGNRCAKAMARECIYENKIIEGKIRYSYDISWSESEVSWEDRMQIYLTEDHLVPAQVHWYSISNSIMVALISVAFIVVILFRHVRHDFVAEEESDFVNGSSSPQEQVGDQEREQELEEKGWKLIRTNIFEPTRTSYPALLAACCGTGAQFFGASLLVVLGLTLGYLSWVDSNNQIMLLFLTSYTLLSVANGIITGQFAKTFGLANATRSAWYSITVLPTISLLLSLLVNSVAASQSSVRAIPVSTILGWAGICWIISAFLIYGGSVVGFTYFGPKFSLSPADGNGQPSSSQPDTFLLGIMFHGRSCHKLSMGTKCCTCLTILVLIFFMVALLLLWGIKRLLVKKGWWSPNFGGFYIATIGAAFAFGCLYVEEFFLMVAAWMEQYYDVFGFLSIVFILEVVMCSLVSLLFAYHQLCTEGCFSWWWQFISSGGAAVMVFVYSLFWYEGLSPSGIYTPVYYFSTMFWTSLCLFLAMGYIGVTGSIYFIRTILRRVNAMKEHDSTEPLMGMNPNGTNVDDNVKRNPSIEMV